MQESFNGDFDLQVRSIMEEAQEPAPAGAWEAISSRLDALAAGAAGASPVAGASKTAGAAALRPAARPMRRVWAWSGAALAMAAAVALGVFVFSPREAAPGPVEMISGDGLMAEATASEMPGSPVTAEVPGTPAVSVLTPVSASVREQKAADLCTEPENSASREQNEAVLYTEPQEPETEASVAENPAPVAAAPATADPFAVMAQEDARKAKARRGTSVILGGGATSNNSAGGNLSLAAPGAYTLNSITESSKSSFGIPMTFGVGVRFRINDMLSVGTGLDWSLLVRSFEGIYNADGSNTPGDIRHSIQYIGIPANLFVDLFDTMDLHFYAMAGAEAEYAVSNRYSLLGTSKSVSARVDGLQWSAGAGIGAEFAVSSKLNLFLEPQSRYYFDCGQPKSVRTEKPFMLIVRAGLRFDL